MRLPLGPNDLEPVHALLTAYLESARGASSSSNVVQEEVRTYQEARATLTGLSRTLALDAGSRLSFFESGYFDYVVEFLSTSYAAFARIQATRPLSQESKDDVHHVEAREADRMDVGPGPYSRSCNIVALCLRVLRNGLAGCSDAQARLCSRFHLVAPFMSNMTRFHTLNDPDASDMCRAAVQMLSNLITANPDVQREMWPKLVTQERPEDQLVLGFLTSPDTATQSAAQILLINLIRSTSTRHDAQQRCLQLCTHPQGLRIIESLLTSSESMMLRTASAAEDRAELDENGLESEIEGLEESLGFIYTIFSVLFEEGFSSLLVSALAPVDHVAASLPTSGTTDAPIISSSQLTLLKLLDGWLHSLQKEATASFNTISAPETGRAPERRLRCPPIASRVGGGLDARRGAGLSGLLDIFLRLSSFARDAMLRGTAKDGAPADQQPQDRRLIGVHHGLLLVLQSLLSVGMTADGWSESDDMDSQRDDVGFVDLSRFLLFDMRGNDAFVDELIALLHQTHQYAPALSPFRPQDAKGQKGHGNTGSNGDEEEWPLPQGHALSSTGRAAQETSRTRAAYGFDHLKRDIVRVLGSLVYAPATRASAGSRSNGTEAAEAARPQGLEGTRATALDLTTSQIRRVQDRVRERGGLYHVLNMTVLDERNPYMREHAIFTLRYLLAGNIESQTLVGSLQPASSQDDKGGLQLPMV